MIYEFGPFRYDAERRLLFRGNDLVPLVPKAVDTLHVLVERHGQVVEKAELMKLVWPDTTVEEIGLARNVSILRKALSQEAAVGEEGGAEAFIETIPKRGYRFAAPVAEVTDAAQVTDAAPVAEAPTAARRPRRAVLAGAAGGFAALLVGGLVYYQFFVPSRYLARDNGSGRLASLAVIPFPCLCPQEQEGDAYSQGLTEALVTEVSKLPGVQVVAPSTVRRHQNAGVSTGLMGRLLGLDALLEGTMQKQNGSGVRVTARLVDVHTGRVIWAESYDRPAGEDASGLQRDLSRAIAAALAQKLK